MVLPCLLKVLLLARSPYVTKGPVHWLANKRGNVDREVRVYLPIKARGSLVPGLPLRCSMPAQPGPGEYRHKYEQVCHVRYQINV